jgi:hypothetical protein
MIARMRNALELVVEATDGPQHRKRDPAWLRGALLAARPLIQRSHLVGLSGDGQDHCVWTCRHGRHVSVRRVASLR